MSLTANISSAKQFRRLAKSLNDSAIDSGSYSQVGISDGFVRFFQKNLLDPKKVTILASAHQPSC